MGTSNATTSSSLMMSFDDFSDDCASDYVFDYASLKEVASVGPSIGPSVGLSVGPFVSPSVPCYFRTTKMAVFEGKKSSNGFIIHNQ